MQTFIHVLNITRFRVDCITKEFHVNDYVSEKWEGFKQITGLKTKARTCNEF